MASITAQNSVYILSVPGVFGPVQLQGYSSDDMFGTDPIQVSETMMGVDRTLSAGLINVVVPTHITLQADSQSNLYFDAWYAAQRQLLDIFFAVANVTLTATGLKYALTKGALKTYAPMAEHRKVQQPRKFMIEWESISQSLV